MADETIPTSLPKSRREAKALGAKWYFTDAPCVHGHVSKRSAARGQCNQCRKEEDALAQARKDRMRRREQDRQYEIAYWSRPENRARRLKNRRAKYATTRVLERERGKALREKAAGRPRPETCEVCNDKNSDRGLAFDHCHVTGQFRGWICGRCNVALAMVRDNPNVLRNLADYLERHNAAHPQINWIEKAEIERVLEVQKRPTKRRRPRLNGSAPP